MARAMFVPYPEKTPDAVPPDDYQRIQTSPDMFGGLTAQATQKAGAQLSQLGEQATNVYDQLASTQAYSQYQQAVSSALYGDPSDPTKKGYLSLTGEDAMKALPGIQQNMEQLIGKIKGGLMTTTAQIDFERSSRRLQSYVMEQAGRHYDQAQKVWGVSTLQGAQSANERMAANSYNDDEAFKHLLEDQNGAAVKQSQLTGTNPVTTMAESRSKLVAARLNGALAQRDFTGAKQIFDQYGSMLDDKLRPTYQSHIHAGSDAALGDDMLRNAQGRGGAASAPGTPTASDPRGMTPVIVAAAQRYGVDPDVALKVARSEGLGTFSGDGGKSGGAFQLYTGGGLGNEFQRDTGLDPLDPKNEPATIDYAMRRLSETGWTPYHGAARVGVGPREGIGVAGAAPGSTPDTIALGSTPPVAPPPGMADLANTEAELARQHARTIANLAADPRGADNPTAFAHAMQKADVEFRSRQMAITAQKQAIIEARNAAADGYVQRMMKGPIDPSLVTQMADDQHLDASSRENLYRLYEAHTKQTADGDTAKYGTKFFDYYKRVTAPDGDPNKIRDPSQIYALAVPKEDGSQDLTLAGVDKLKSELQSARSPERVGETKMRDGAVSYAKHQLSFEADYGTFKLRDPKGEDIFNISFLPAFYQYYEKGIAEGKTPAELLKKENIDSLISPLKRTDAQRARDMIEGGVDTTKDATAPADLDLKSQAGIVSAYQRGKISRDQASQALIVNGFAAPAAPEVHPPMAR